MQQTDFQIIFIKYIYSICVLMDSVHKIMQVMEYTGYYNYFYFNCSHMYSVNAKLWFISIDFW
jgi:hypothetical protein